MRFMTIILLLVCGSVSAQKATATKDTAYYKDFKYTKGDTLLIGYGSKSNKEFAFIQMGSLMAGLEDLQKHFSKTEAVIDKITVSNKKVTIRAKSTDKTVGALGGNKVFIDIEGAVDNGEIIPRTNP